MSERANDAQETATKRKVSIIAIKSRVLCKGSALSPSARLVAITLADFFIGDRPEVFPAVSTIGSLCGMRERATRAAIRELEEAHIITVVEGSQSGTRRSNCYDFTAPDLGRLCRGGSNCKCEQRDEDAPRKARPAMRSKRSVPRGDGGRFAASTSAESAEVGSNDLGTDRTATSARNADDLGTERHPTSADSADEAATERLHTEEAAEAGKPDGAAAAPSLATNDNATDEVEQVAALYARAFGLANETTVRVTPGLREAVRAALAAGYTREEVIAVAVLSWLDDNDFYKTQNPALPLKFSGSMNHTDKLKAQLWIGMQVPDHVAKVVKIVGAEHPALVAYFRSRTKRPSTESAIAP